MRFNFTLRTLRSAVLAIALLLASLAVTAPAGAGAGGGTYTQFIQTVWAFESSIDPTQQSFYEQNWKSPVINPYPLVTHPGRVIRDRNGNPVMSGPLTVMEYFQAIGVDHYFDEGRPLAPWDQIQSNVVNYLGFVGFQFQESDLHDLGYYKYAMVTFEQKIYPSHYVDVPTSNWANGVTAFLDTNSAQVSEPTWVTDVIHWNVGEFTGKNEVHSYADFTNPTKHVLIIEEHFDNKYHAIVMELAAHGKALSDYLGTTVTWSGLHPAVKPPPEGRNNAVTITMSGLLAGAHLRGAEGVIDLLVNNQNPADESGTHILQYVQDYAGYQTPYHLSARPH